MLRHVLAVAAVFAFAVPALAEEAPNPPPTDGAWGMEGQFVFNQNDGKAKGCRLDLSKDEKGGHYTPIVADDCTTQFEFLGKVSTWDLAGDDGFVLLDAAGATIIELHPAEGDSAVYVGTNAADQRSYYMERISG